MIGLWVLRRNTRVSARMRYPNRIATPSFQSVSHPDHRMIKPDTTKAVGARMPAAGMRYGRSALGRRLRSTPRESGAPAYIKTLALVISPTRDCQLGNGRKQMQPTTKEVITPIHGTLRPLSRSYQLGK